MLSGRRRFSALTITSEGPFPLGPFPRHIWIHSNTPQDGLDKACHEIWKRVQQLSEELQSPPLRHVLCSDLFGTLQADSTSSQSNSYWLDEPEGLESIYRAMIGKREREMKLRALCDVQLSAKAVIPSLLGSGKSPKNSRGPEDGSVAGAHSREGSERDVPLVRKHPDTARAAGSQVTAEEFIPNGTFGSAKSSTALSSPTAAESQAAGQRQQLPVFARICSTTDSKAVTRNPVTAATQDKKNVKYNATASGFSMASMSTAPHQPAWQSLNFPPFPVFPNHSNIPPFQGPYHPRAQLPLQQALPPALRCCSRQVAPYSPQPFFQPPYTLTLNYGPLLQPGYPYQQMTPPPMSRNMQDPSLTAGDGIQHPFSPSYWFSSRPGGTVATNLNYFSSGTYVKF